MKKRYQIEKYTILFAIGGMAYFLLENGVKGEETDRIAKKCQEANIRVAYEAGEQQVCFLCCGLLNENVKIKISFISQMVLSSVIITVLELITGFIVNIWLKMDIWDYSHLPYNFKGQICLLYSVFWFLISSVAIVLDDFLRYKLFNEEKPRYKIF